MGKVISKLSNEELDLVVGGGKGFFASIPAGMGSNFKHNEGWTFNSGSGELSKGGFYTGKYLVLSAIALVPAVVTGIVEYFAVSKKKDR